MKFKQLLQELINSLDEDACERVYLLVLGILGRTF